MMILLDIFGETGYRWNSIEEMNKVDNVVRMHGNFAGLLMPFVYFWQLYVPLFKYVILNP